MHCPPLGSINLFGLESFQSLATINVLVLGPNLYVKNLNIYAGSRVLVLEDKDILRLIRQVQGWSNRLKILEDAVVEYPSIAFKGTFILGVIEYDEWSTHNLVAAKNSLVCKRAHPGPLL
jgi:hypothetical protein